jgi:uncharacterized protein YjbI with pentapeptide repeats
LCPRPSKRGHWDLSYTDFAGPISNDSDLSFAELSYCDFTAANFSPSEYAAAVLDWAVMIGSNFELADLTLTRTIINDYVIHQLIEMYSSQQGLHISRLVRC